MLDAFNIAATGLQSQQTQVETIANNLANVNTDGYKKSRVVFQDMVSNQLNVSASGLINNSEDSSMGIGSLANNLNKIFTQGDAKPTDRNLDIFIQGAGFLEVVMPDGRNAYTRLGSLNINSDGALTNSEGLVLSSFVQIPPDAQEVIINAEGEVSVIVDDEEAPVQVGNIELASFVNDSGLSALGNGLYLPTADSGDAAYGRPGETGFGGLQQGFLESSNVNLVEELTTLTTAQRGYELNARVVQAADDMLSIINTLRR